MTIFRNIFLPVRFFLAGTAVIIFLVAGYALPVFYAAGIISLVILFIITLADIFLLSHLKKPVDCKRKTPNIMGLGDENSIRLRIRNNSSLSVKITLIDEIPVQFQERNFSINLRLTAHEENEFTYKLRPLKRGTYHFGKINLYLSSPLGLVQRRIIINEAVMVPVYPSVLQMKELEMKAFSKISLFNGIKKLRRLGHSYEFEQIKNYVSGDDYRSINWKATGRRAALMVNQYEDERSQQVYFVIDKSRSMRMPFNGLSLLDYSINTTLVMANIALRKQDKAGLLTFSSKMETILKADRTNSQLNKIFHHLYRESENRNDANYEMLYTTVRNAIRVRSLLILFTNFESMYAMERVLPVLRKISRFHLLVVVFFENTELNNYAASEVSDIHDIYLKTVAGKFSAEKEQIVNQLRLYGIQAIQTSPENLSVNLLNKYLELKSRGMI